MKIQTCLWISKISIAKQKLRLLSFVIAKKKSRTSGKKTIARPRNEKYLENK
jgi:hypothetical protein